MKQYLSRLAAMWRKPTPGPAPRSRGRVARLGLEALESWETPSASATHLVISKQPGNIVGGNPITVAVKAVNSAGQVINYSNLGQVSLSLQNNPTRSALAGTLRSSQSKGVITLTGKTIYQAGVNYSLKVSAPGLPAAFTNNFKVTTAPASTLVWTGKSPSGFGWHLPANWNLYRKPVNGDTLVFPNGPARKTSYAETVTATSLKAIKITGSNYDIRMTGAGTGVYVGSIALTGSGNLLALPTGATLGGYTTAYGASGPTLGNGYYYNILYAASCNVTGSHAIVASARNILYVTGPSYSPVFAGTGAVFMQGQGVIHYNDLNSYNSCQTVVAGGNFYMGVYNASYPGPRWGHVFVEGGTLGTALFVQGQPMRLQTLILDAGANIDQANLDVAGVTYVNAKIAVNLTNTTSYLYLRGGLAGSGHVTFYGNGYVHLARTYASMVSAGQSSVHLVFDL